MRNLLTIFLLLTTFLTGISQDTTIVQTLTFDSTGRSYVFNFPPDTGQTYEKILMLYTMRCKDGLVSPPISGQTNIGCGEWDYSCNTFITDSNYTDSIKASAPSHIITGFSGTTYNYTTQPTYTYYSFNQYDVTYDSIISETTTAIDTGTLQLSHPFQTANIVSKSQYLWRASELTSAGLSAGDISGIRLDVSSASTGIGFLRIKMKHTTQDSLVAGNPELNGFTEVYFLNTTLVNGINEFRFYNNFTWDGTSNILIEFSFTNTAAGTNNMLSGYDTGENLGIISKDNDYCLEFGGSGNVSLETTNFNTIGDEITVSLWTYGNPDVLPVNNSVFEGSDTQGRRQINVHLPWSNSSVYWDCGNNGNYDRINKLAVDSEYKGGWNHWAFTKNAATGSMKIYLNGTQWHSGTGKTKAIELITNMKLGSSKTGSNPYFGKVDEVRIWNAELSQTEISGWMYKTINTNHPNYTNLISYYTANEGSGNTIADSITGNTGIFNNVVNWRIIRGNELFKNFTETTQRPNIIFIQGTYNSTVSTVTIVDSLENSPNIVYAYQVTGTDLTPVDTNIFYQSGYSYIYDYNTDSIIDSVFFATENTINITTLNYYNKYPSKFELMSFVTPYGIDLDLGMEGKTWQFDVSDYAPILKDAKKLSMELGGQYQEQMDIKFLFISGTPPRDVIDIQQIWRAGVSRSYTAIMNDNVTEPRMITLNPTASMYKIKSTITGHGQEGEFIPRTHFININGGANEFEWQVWKECADNPIYPQGGTWIYDRAGWCPGAPSDMQEFDISGMVTPGQTVEIDYGVTSGSGTSNYLVNNQLVSYGAANFNLDAGIVEIKRPSKRIEYDRINPICYNPVVVIRNTGATQLTSLDITYSVSGGVPETYNWTGSLNFMETEEVILPITDGNFWIGDGNNIFTVEVSLPNNGQDEYAQNNIYSSTFTLPDFYANSFIIVLRTNNYGYQNSYTIKDVNGNIVLSKSGLANNTTYVDTLFLQEGCYTLEFYDSGDNGLYFWALSAQGTGYLKFKEIGGGYIKTFEPEFGKSIHYAFVIGNITRISNPDKESYFEVYPNPSNGMFTVDVVLQNNKNAQIIIEDMTGKIIENKILSNFDNGTFNINLSEKAKGIYNCILITGKEKIVKRIIIQ